MEAAVNRQLDGGKGYPDRLPKQFILAWLYQEKYTTTKDKLYYVPTEKGAAAGLVISEGILSLSEDGQQFVIDHLPQIFDYCKTL